MQTPNPHKKVLAKSLPNQGRGIDIIWWRNSLAKLRNTESIPL